MNLQNPHRLNNTIMRIKELFSINNTQKQQKKHRAYNTACMSDRDRAHHAIEQKYIWIFTKFLTDVMMKKCRQRRTNFGGSRRQ